MEDDYMSDSFLEQICDVRPGLVRGVGKRKLEVHKRNEECKRVGTHSFVCLAFYWAYFLVFIDNYHLRECLECFSGIEKI